MGFDVQSLRTALTGGGARPTLFNVQMSLPSGITNNAALQKLTFTCQGAEIPPSTVGTINVPYFGRMIPYPGDRPPFAPWQVTIINDEDFLVRDVLETWHTLINAREGNIREAASSDPNLVMATAQVFQYGRTDQVNPIRQYQFNYMWPSQISQIDLNWASVDQIETYQVAFSYAWWDAVGPTVSGQNAS